MIERERIVKLNPLPVTRKAKVSDRAQRYRANQRGVKPKGKECAYCGSKRNLLVNHKDGNESNTRPGNLNVACKSCNTRLGFEHKRQGKGRRTNQMNPPVPTFTQYARAVAIHTRNTHDEGGKIIHATPKRLRKEYAELIADLKRQRGTAGGRRSEVPF